MRLHNTFLGRTTALLVAVLLPTAIAFWYILGGFFRDAAASTADRTRAALMNQADRLAFDLDLELTLLDSYLSTADPREALAEYRLAARWPSLVSALYAVEPAAVGEGVRVTRIAPDAGGDDRFATEITRTYAGSFSPARPWRRPERIADIAMTKAFWLFDDKRGPERSRLIVAVLDDNVLIDSIVPSLVSSYLGEGSGFEDYRVEIVDPSGARRFSNGVADGREPDFERPLLMDRSGFDLARFYLSFAPRPGGNGPAPASPDEAARGGLDQDPPVGDMREPSREPFPIDRYRFQSMDQRGIWTLRISGRDLSIAESARRQTLIWSIATAGFIALLYGSVIMIFVSAHRAADLAAMQRDFVASVSHELKTPIAVALSAGENLENGIVPAERVASYGATVAREARRLAESVERLLVMAGLESAQSIKLREPIAIRELLDSIVARLTPAPGAGGASFAVSVEGSPVVDGSRVLLESALDSVMHNAMQYAGGAIRVAAREERRGNRGLVVVTCADDGPGVPRSERRRLFQPFFRGRLASDANIQGTGIGLYLARRISRLHGGNARLRFPTEGGTIAELSFRSYQ